MNMASDWICFTDELYQYINHMQDYCLMPYIPYVVATFHLLYASNQRPKVQYPHAQYEAFLKHTKSTNLINSMMSEMLPSTRKYLNEQCAVLEVLPPLMDIIQPTLRPVNTQLYSNKEKEQLSQLICIMIAYNMTYHQEKTEEGQYAYVLDPNMDEVIRFPGMKHPRQLTYAAKQLIAREIQLEKMRRTESASGTIVQKPEPSHKQKLTAKPITEEEKPIKDFFGRVIKKKTPEPKQKKVEKKNVLTTDIWFHFKEGYSNAVRRNVRIQDFL